MGLFDSWAASSFKRTEDAWIFYPWGALGRGYEIPSDEAYKDLHRWIVRWYGRTFVALIVLGVTLGWLAGGAVVLVIALPIYLVHVNAWKKQLAPSDVRMSITEAQRQQARAQPAWLPWFGLAVSLAFVAMGLLIVWLKPERWPVMLPIAAFFGLCAFAFVRMIRLRKSAASPQGLE